MKTYIKRSLLAAWLFGASLILGYTWYYRPDNFPPLPDSVGRWIVTVSGAKTPEDIAEASLLFGWLASLTLIGSATFLALTTWNWLKQRRA
ncbi:hypothetical protein LMG7141_03864 [Ralstonia condita]|uniref:Transmembrane protein n=1 Tax=Ralstonia condita TaxID=3058600 RepID=A0ABN9J795_9RALS|nr:hypothetical protein [Ralstonia sp. LMG 7141]CAJ0800734.1 hypothetical protein LMG7141_03864 [Ralstonia sp. LMG 7141]